MSDEPLEIEKELSFTVEQLAEFNRAADEHFALVEQLTATNPSALLYDTPRSFFEEEESAPLI